MNASPDTGTLAVQSRWGSVRLSSNNFLVALVILGLFTLLWFAGKLLTSEITAVQQQHQAIRDEHAIQRQADQGDMDVLLYLLSLPGDQRPRLAMPDALRKRLAPASEERVQ